jgi:endonuclease-8
VPEGDTVWRVARRLDAALAGQTLRAAELRVPQLAGAELAGATVREIVPRGKHLLLRLDDGRTLHSHLRMDGMWHLVRSGDPWRGGPAFQVRAVLETAPWTALGYRLPVLDLLPTADEDTVVGHLGPDLLGPDWDVDRALTLLRRDSERAIGEALLDQRLVAGFGTVYRTELCFLHGVHPWTPVGRVEDLPRLLTRGQRLIAANAAAGHQITTGRRRRGEEHWVYGRRRCLRCDTRVEVADQGPVGRQRVSWWCPRCQPSAGTEGISG